MKVLFVSNLFPDASDPVRGRINATLLHRLAREVPVRVIGLRPVLPIFNHNPARLRPCPEDESLKPVYRGVVYVPKVGGPMNHRLLAMDVRNTLLSLRREFPYDVVLGSWVYPDVCGLHRVLSRFRVPLVGIAQGTDVHQYLDMPFRAGLIVKTLNQLPTTITRSRDLAERLRQAGVEPERLRPIYNGVDTSVFQAGDSRVRRGELGWSPVAPVLLYVGNLLPIKNPMLLVRAHARLVAADPGNPPRLVMIGDGPLRGRIEEASRSLGTEGLVDLVGRRPPSEVACHMQAADVLCISSDNEGVPNVAFEAMACGLPVVATRVGGIPEVIDRPELGCMVERGDEDALAAALRDQLAHPLPRGPIATHAVSHSWDATVSAYLEVLRAAVEAGGSKSP